MGLELLLVMLGLGSSAVCADNREKVALCGASDSCKGLFQQRLSPISPQIQILKESGRKQITDGVAELSETMGSPVLCMGEARAFPGGIELQCVVMDRLETWNQRPHVIFWSSLRHCMS